MARKKKGKGKKKAKQNLVTAESEYGKAPHTFVFHRGVVGKSVLQLLLDIRRTMEPYTAASLRTRKKNVLKDFVSVASPLGVTHFMVFTKTDTGTNMRIIKIPRGPTINFKVTQYSLAKDVVSSLKRPNMYASQFRYHPLLVLNNFSKDEPHLKLAATILQNMFPSINVHKVQLNKIRRCVLFNYDPETKLIEFRHYSIKLVPVGISRSVKKLLKTKVPDLSRYKDVSDFFLNAGQLSESEAEQEGPDNEVTVPQSMSSRGNIAAQKSAIRLVEIGPRMQLQMVKIEEGMCEGEVMYHQFVQKTSQEIAEARTLRLQRMKAKEKRKKLQKANVDSKTKQKEEHKQKSLDGIKKKTEQEEKSSVKAVGEEQEEEEVDDDTEYYRQEVGEDPDPALFPKQKRLPRTDKRKASSQGTRLPQKKFKFSSKSSKDSENKVRKGMKGNTRRQDSQERTSSKTFGKKSPSMRAGKKSGPLGRNANKKFGSPDRTQRRGHPAGKGGATKLKKGKVAGGKVMKKSKVKGR
ncbi:suppressor of SWI4 1 homolog isoform X2 [Patiria miniata]|uniref:Brix domain-containing protein n=1 Tax=Patiria miniata TaxID=46514 RepID=A0A913Z6F8_PATMI|nr:suppressor of SWI4 1 homolog isoform X2 [Patiria miniata]